MGFQNEILKLWNILCEISIEYKVVVFVSLLCSTMIDGPINRLLGGRAAHDVKKSVVCITGCDSGFGLYMSKKLKSLGYIVVSTCLTTEGAKLLKDDHEIYTVVVNLMEEEEAYMAIGKAVRNALAENPGSKLWGLVNNAGIAPMGFTDWMGIDTFRKAMEVNYFAVIGVTKELLPLLKQCKNSRIINISSMAGKAASASFGPYSGSKHALEGYSKALRYELRPFDIHVANVNPGFMNTPLIDVSLNLAQKALENASAEITRFYEVSTILKSNSDGLLRIKEPLNTVGDYVVDHLIVTGAPCFNNYVGWQASAGRWYIFLPQGLQELLGKTFTPVLGIKKEQVHLEQTKESVVKRSRNSNSTDKNTGGGKHVRQRSKSRKTKL